MRRPRRGRTATSRRSSSRAIFRARSSASTTRATARDVGELGAVLAQPRTGGRRRYGQTDALFWADPSIRRAASQVAERRSARFVRLRPRRSSSDLYFKRPPLHANAAFVMFLAARRYDALAPQVPNRIARCARCTPTRVAHAASDRDDDGARPLLVPVLDVGAARRVRGSRAALRARLALRKPRRAISPSNLERYHLAAQKAIERADAFYRARAQYATRIRSRRSRTLERVSPSGVEGRELRVLILARLRVLRGDDVPAVDAGARGRSAAWRS